MSYDGHFDLKDDDSTVIALKKYNYVTVRDLHGKNGSVVVRDTQAVSRPRHYNRIQVNSTPGSGTISGQFVDITLPKAQYVTDVAEVYIRITLTETASSATVIPPGPYVFDRIEIQASGATIQTIYNDNLFWQFAHYTRAQTDTLSNFKQLGFDNNWFPSGISLNNSAFTYTFPIIGDFVSNFMFNQYDGDLVYRFYFANPIASSGSGTLTYSNFSLLLDAEVVPSRVAFDEQSIADRYPVSVSYLQPVRQSQTLTMAAGQNPILLSGFNGRFTHLQFAIRSASATNASDGFIKTMQALGGAFESGTGGLIELLDASGMTMMSTSGLEPQFLRSHIAAQHYASNFSQRWPVYTLPFTENIGNAVFKGTNDGFIDFTSKEILRLTPATGVAETAEVQTLSLRLDATPATIANMNAITSGSITLGYKGQYTPPLLFSDTSATVLAALHALPAVKFDGITFAMGGATINAANASGLTFTITGFREIPSATGGMLTVGSCSFGTVTPASLKPVFLLTTPGVVATAFTLGSVRVDVYGYRYQHVLIVDSGARMDKKEVPRNNR